MPLNRRRFIAAAAFLGAPASALRAQGPRAVTPRMTEGPFYPEAFPAEPRANLVRGPLMGKPAPLSLEGRVVDRFGKPLGGARVEIWQCDGLGRYTHSRDGTPDDRDANFLGYGWVRADAEGRYAFSTIRPVPYSGRTPHIHVAVMSGGTPLVTQMFVEGEAQNRGDFLYAHMPVAQRALVTVRIESIEGRQRAVFDIVTG
jgi:protocatechuate 3,4-dioxygenase beta subunit